MKVDDPEASSLFSSVHGNPVSSRRIMAVWMKYFSADLYLKRLILPDNSLFILYKHEVGRNLIVAVDPRAATHGIAPGQVVADVRSLYPDLVAHEADPMRDRRVLERLADWCGRYTPWAGIDEAAGPGEAGLFLDVTGCTHLRGGETAFLRQIERHFTHFGLEIRLSLTESPGSAWAWARFRPPEAPSILETGMAEAALGPLPVEALRIPAATVETLRRLGLKRIADLASLPRPALAARFGEALLRRLDQALGRVAESIAPRRPPAVYAVHQDFAEPLMVPEALGAVLARLLPRLCRQLERGGRGARRLVYTLYRIDGSTASAAIGTSQPVRDPAHLAKLFAPRLETLDPDPGIEALRLEAPETALFASNQAGLVADPDRGTRDRDTRDRAPRSQGDELAALIDSLANRLGPDRIGYLAPQALHLPERQSRFVSALGAEAPDWSTWPAATPAGVGAASVPLRLFPELEAIEIEEAAPTPEAPPRVFLWRRQRHRTARGQGPDRRLGAWWQGDRGVRDYWAVEDQAGRRLWLCRDLATGRWFVHGLLAPADMMVSP